MGNASKDLNRLKRKLTMTDLAMNSPTDMSEDEQEAEEEEDGDRKEGKENDMDFWFKFMEKQIARANVSGARRHNGTEEERKAAAEFKRRNKVKKCLKRTTSTRLCLLMQRNASVRPRTVKRCP